jgi:hypothetical protein
MYDIGGDTLEHGVIIYGFNLWGIPKLLPLQYYEPN